MNPASTEASGLHKSHSLPELDHQLCSTCNGNNSTDRLLFHYLLQKARMPCPVKATISKRDLDTTAEDLLQHLSYLAQTG